MGRWQIPDPNNVGFGLWMALFTALAVVVRWYGTAVILGVCSVVWLSLWYGFKTMPVKTNARLRAILGLIALGSIAIMFLQSRAH